MVWNRKSTAENGKSVEQESERMSLREEMARYEQLRGESAEHTPIIKMGAYLDGVDKGIEELEKIKAEFIKRYPHNYCGEPELGGVSCVFSLNEVLEIIDNHISELKGVQE